MKKTFLLLTASFMASHAFADNITTQLGKFGDGIYSYTPYVQGLGYVLAGIIGIIGAFSVYMSYINEARDMTKRVLRWGGACLALLTMSTALPQFFGYESSGLIADGGSSSQLPLPGGGYAGGDTWGTIDPSIPGMDSGKWSDDERFINGGVKEYDSDNGLWSDDDADPSSGISGGGNSAINKPGVLG